jgi:hypothetical protein
MVATGATSQGVPEVLGDAGEDDGDGYVLGVRESIDSTTWSLLFMECDEAEDDTYCLVVDPGQATYYGGVRECELSERELNLVLTAEAAEELGTPTDLRFALALDTDQWHMVRRGLSRVLTSGRAEEVPHRLAM